MINQNTRDYRTKRITLLSAVTTTIKITTSVFGAAVSVGDYYEMAAVAKVTAAASSGVGIALQVSPDGGTTWGTGITIDADMTTTANNTYASVTNFGDTVRVMGVPSTTSTICSYSVSAVMKR